MEDIILYHGSEGEIQGSIQPVSRPKCDFGQGFYLGESKMQAAGLVVSDASPKLYRVKLHLSDISEERILHVTDKDWLYMVLANRGMVNAFNQTELAKYWLEKTNQYDVIVGLIADDRMNVAMNEYAAGNLTDEGLLACLHSVKYGNQYVLKTEFACTKVEILEKKDLYGKEASDLELKMNTIRQQNVNVVKENRRAYRYKGQYLDELIAGLEAQKVRRLSEEQEVIDKAVPELKTIHFFEEIDHDER